ncbi:MAG: glyoxalase [Chloroflexi bacterium]|nr:MAG: glyoxalase [Chloroflexota bacterium]TME44378.1 MAG: glyoxalase [Chloroflexota bacterium]
MNMTLEVIPVPVSDTDRAIAFYKKVGFNVDMDQRMSDELRFVQLTPPGSGCSIHIGEGMSTLDPGTVKGLILVVDSAEAAKAELDKRGVETSDIEPQPWGKHVYFTDPDGNSWTLQESFARSMSRQSSK